jgi:hypothetical protein
MASRVAVGTSGPLQSQAATDLNNVVCDYPKANAALHTFEPSVPTAIQSMAPLQHAYAAFASGPPALSGSEPTRVLCSFLRSLRLLLQFGTATRLTPIPWMVFSFFRL